MPEGIEVVVAGGFATITPPRRGRGKVLGKLLDVTHGDSGLIERDTYHGTITVPESVAFQAGLLDQEAPAATPPPVTPQKARPAAKAKKAAPRKAPAKKAAPRKAPSAKVEDPPVSPEFSDAENAAAHAALEAELGGGGDTGES